MFAAMFLDGAADHPQQVAANRAFGARYRSNLRKVSLDREKPPYRRPTDAELFGYLPL